MTMTFQQTNTAQNAALNNYCSTVGGTIEAGRLCTVGGTAGSTEQTFTTAISQADDNEFSFECTVPADSTWGAGNWTINVFFTTGNMDATWESVFVCRVNSSDVNQETLASGTGLGIATTGSLPVQTVVNQSSSASPDAGDKVIITLGFSNINTMFTRDVGITPSQTIVAAGFTAPTPTGSGVGYYQHYYRNVVLN